MQPRSIVLSSPRSSAMRSLIILCVLGFTLSCREPAPPTPPPSPQGNTSTPQELTLPKSTKKRPGSKPVVVGRLAFGSSLFVRAQVGDVAKWRAELKPALAKLDGLIWSSISKDQEDPRFVVAHFVGRKSEALKAWGEATLPKGQRSLGKNLLINSPNKKLKKKTVSLIARYKVDSTEAWTQAFQKGGLQMRKAGIVAASVSQDPADTSAVIVHLSGEKLDTLKAYSAKLKGTRSNLWSAQDLEIKRY